MNSLLIIGGDDGGGDDSVDPLSDPDIIAEFDTAWTESNPGSGTDPDRAEQGGWIVEMMMALRSDQDMC